MLQLRMGRACRYRGTGVQVTAPVIIGRWAARCDCYHAHQSSSGRCTQRDVTDPDAKVGAPVLCAQCKAECVK